MSQVAAAASLPRKLIRASAGSGKTFRISTELIRLLALGEDPAEIFASTFTRKAAGEILTRVLRRLALAALTEGEAAALAGHTKLDGRADAAFWGGVLERTVRHLHRLNVGTLDAFFVRCTRCFALELGLPPRWTIADEAARRRLLELALGDALRAAEPAALAQVVRAMAADRSARSVHDRLLGDAEALLAVHRGTDPRAAGVWEGFAAVAPGHGPSGEERGRLADALVAAETPVAKTTGKPPAAWTRALERTAGLVREGKWADLLKDTLCRAALEEVDFARHPVPEGIVALFEAACAMARPALARRYAHAGRATGAFAGFLERALEARARERGLFGFDDVTRAMAGAEPLGARLDLHYRLDARTRHILLDEFQDTSLAQWEGLEPLADELFSGHLDERAGVVVADPKQSIYGWRGGAPELVDALDTRYRFAAETLATSYRSSQVVLDFVNGVFGALADLPIWEDDAVGAAQVGRWLGDFTPHRAHRELPGHVRVEVGPADEGRGARPNLCRAAAERVAELQRAAPGRTIGVLTRGNATVARMIMELKRLGVPTSEEGGTPLTDAASVASVLALLRLADHPGNTVVRYHVAHTPVGEALGYVDWEDEKAALRLSHDIRRRLVVEGYGATLAELAARVRESCDAREWRRLGQLVELAYQWEDEATLRPSDFVRFVHMRRVEDPTASDVRVMTVHQAKGLEFDVVVLPELDAPLTRTGGAAPLAYRPSPTARITRVFPYVPADQRRLFPELPELEWAAEQAHAAELRDAVSGLYVALTRARHAVHILVKPDGRSGISRAKSSARVLREALAPEVPAEEGVVLHESGDPGWAAVRQEERRQATPGEVHAASPAGGAEGASAAAHPGPVRLKAGRRSRILQRRSPSELEGGNAVDLRLVLMLGAAGAMARGTVAHRWFEEVAWVEDGLPDGDRLAALAAEVAPDMPGDEVAALADAFRGWTEQPELRRLLSRGTFGPEVRLEREYPFLRREEDYLMEGFIDRLVVTLEDGRPVAAHVLDYKTDDLAAGDAAALEQRLAHYRPQMQAYRRAVAELFGLEVDAVRGALAFVGCGVVVEVAEPPA